METKFVPAGTYLFRVGDMDDSIYVVQSGNLSVYISEKEKREYLIKKVGQGEHICSLLSVMDILSVL